MRLLGQFQTSLFFYEKILSERKVQKAQKRKQANKNQKKQHFHAHKNIYGEESRLFAFLCLLFAQRLFVKKKIKKFEIALITSFTLLLTNTEFYCVCVCMCVCLSLNHFKVEVF